MHYPSLIGERECLDLPGDARGGEVLGFHQSRPPQDARQIEPEERNEHDEQYDAPNAAAKA
jgi:hypothetical protein